MMFRFSMRSLADVAKGRRDNKYDVIIAISGERGNGKSTLAWRLARMIGGFLPERDIVYDRDDVMRLLEKRKKGIIIDDEAVRTSFKRNFQQQGQIQLIQMLNMYRSNFNILIMCVPTFYNLDKEIKRLVKIHIHVPYRGYGIVHMPNKGMIYVDDPWDIERNRKIELMLERNRKNKGQRISSYNRLTTCKGWIKYKQLSDTDEERYNTIKEEKRTHVHQQVMGEIEAKVQDEPELILSRIEDGTIRNKEEAILVCQTLGKTWDNIRRRISDLLAVRRNGQTLGDLWVGAQGKTGPSYNQLDDSQIESNNPLLLATKET